MTSTGIFNSYSFSCWKISGLAASNKKFWMLCLPYLLPPGHSLKQRDPAWHIGSSANQALIFAFRELLSNLLLNIVSRKAVALSKSVAREPSGALSSSPPHLNYYLRLLGGVLLLGGGNRPTMSVPLYCVPETDSCGSTPLCVPYARALLICPLWT